MAQIPSGTKFIGIDASVPTPELNGKRINDKTEHYTVEDIAAFAGVGSQGPQGVEGPAGPPGPVGPAGLEWQGQWDTDSSYAVDDAVGFNGASWFCIASVTGTGNPNPEVDTTSWALLAAQGATGPQGAQGPTGPQGPQGESASSSIKEVKIEITQAEILNVSGFSKQLVSSVPGKILAPMFISVYRRTGGTAYSISNSIRLFSSSNAGSSSIGSSTFDSLFTNTTVATAIASLTASANFSIVSGNSLHLASGSLSSPSTITGGTGNLILSITYNEVSIT
jgi:hypothetical protein